MSKPTIFPEEKPTGAVLSRSRMTVAVFVLLLVAISILIFFSAVFSGLETALFTLKPHQLRRLEEHHPALTKFIHAFRENPRGTSTCCCWVTCS